MKEFAVIGNPIEHSKSPEIHMAFAAQFDIELRYSKILVDKGAFNVAASEFFECGTGANVTLPFKEDALQFADVLSERAQLAGAVNTLSKKEGLIIGDNTDGIGLVRDIRDNYGQSFLGKKILIIGAGGATRGVLLPIATEKPQLITIVNRTYKKAEQLAAQFTDYAALSVESFESLESPFDIIINATSASLSGQTLPLNEKVFTFESFAYDMMYGATPTLFMQQSTQRGGRCADGLGMLVEQAAQSFEIWHGVKPCSQPVIRSIRDQLS
ncbi:MAG: shikimate dehydrogenase [Gammaproteobacteria bacterium]|nr:shikimate dehydrogenase [Gammaproteobacteria bacterium]